MPSIEFPCEPRPGEHPYALSVRIGKEEAQYFSAEVGGCSAEEWAIARRAARNVALAVLDWYKGTHGPAPKELMRILAIWADD